MDTGRHDALLALTMTEGFGQATIRRCLDAFGSADAVLGATVDSLSRLEQVGVQKARKLRSALDETISNGVVRAELELVEKHGVQLFALGDESYPRLLRHIPDPPALLWVRGDMVEEDALSLGVVGSRRCTHYGREQADRFASLCAQSE